jgi:hypothetical protein
MGALQQRHPTIVGPLAEGASGSIMRSDNAPAAAAKVANVVMMSDSEDDDYQSQSSSVRLVEAGAANNRPSRKHQSSTHALPKAQCATIPVYSKGNFEEVYVASIQTPLMMVESQFSQLQWNEAPVEVHPPATDIEVCYNSCSSLLAQDLVY